MENTDQVFSGLEKDQTPGVTGTPIKGHGVLNVDVIHDSLLSGRSSLKAKGNFCPFRNFEQKLIYISYWNRNVNTFSKKCVIIYIATSVIIFYKNKRYFLIIIPYKAIPAATDTLKDSFCPNIGISTTCWHCSNSSGVIP